jgi:hypothetical protein
MYKRMAPNTNDYQKNYMRRYVSASEDIYCKHCNCCYKKYRRYRHIKTQKHLRNIENEKKDVFESPVMKRLLAKVEVLEKLLMKDKDK